jgi:ABC-2 type transport system ATP-binding protein
MTGEDYIFEVTNLRKSFGDKPVLQGMTFKVLRGEILGVIGKSGSGKSTLMNIISGAIDEYDGLIGVKPKGMVINRPEDIKRIIGFSFQPHSFYEELTLWDNLAYFGRLYGLSSREIRKRAQELFRLTDLDMNELDLPANALSGGMKKRFDIVVALLHNPAILILDEPTAGLDPLRRKDIINIIRRINRNGVTVIVISHIMSDIDGVVDRVMLIDKGKVLLIAPPKEVKVDLLESELIFLRTVPGNYEPIIKSLSSFSILRCEVVDDNLLIHTPESEVLIHYLLHLLEAAGESVERLMVSEPDLADVFDHLDRMDEPKVLLENVRKLHAFVESVTGKSYDQKAIKDILRTHAWPPEAVDVLYKRKLAREVRR